MILVKGQKVTRGRGTQIIEEIPSRRFRGTQIIVSGRVVAALDAAKATYQALQCSCDCKGR